MPLPTLTVPLRGRGRPRTQAPKIRSTVVISDLHCPDLDPAAYGAVLSFIKDKCPDYLIIAGDLLDLYTASRFEKDPRIINRTQEELEMANDVLDQLQEASPSSIMKITMGNHEARLTHRLFENPDILEYTTKAGDPNDVLANALSLSERGIDWIPYPYAFNHYGFTICHGQAVGQHPAKKEAEKYGLSGCSGHIHRGRYWESKNRRGLTQWWSLGGLCKHDVAYLPENDWTHSFGYLEQVVDSDAFTFHPLTIVSGRFLFGGKLYCSEGAFETV
jgi:hypothetical protein